mmetsp:Transcript_5610/g.13197  ORF Transcript_5610/g.13197 Transcript_5610/m.13197 type:complete len:236 (-) Transcript_5610:745-1452(-)
MITSEKVMHPILAIDDQFERIMNIRQKGAETNIDYITRLVKEVEEYERLGGYYEESLKAAMDEAKRDFLAEQSTAMTAEQEEEELRVQEKIQREQVEAMFILKRVDKKRYGNLLIELHNSYLLGKDYYPKTAADVLRLLNNYKQQEWSGNRPPDGARQTSERPGGGNNANARNLSKSFLLSSGEEVCFCRGTNNSFFPHIICHLCELKGHYQSHCPIRLDPEGTIKISKTQTNKR